MGNSQEAKPPPLPPPPSPEEVLGRKLNDIHLKILHTYQDLKGSDVWGDNNRVYNDYANTGELVMDIVDRLIQVFDKNILPEKAISLSQVRGLAKGISHNGTPISNNEIEFAFNLAKVYFGPGTIDAFNNTGLKVTQLRLSPNPIRDVSG